MPKLNVCKVCGTEPDLKDIDPVLHQRIFGYACANPHYVECEECDNHQFGATPDEAAATWNRMNPE